MSVAGSSLAVGDFRMKRLIPPLKKAAQKAAVFGKIAIAAERLVEGSEKDSAKNLLTLAMLVNAVLYTQGETTVKGKFTELETADMEIRTRPSSARVLKPLREALTRTGSGRFEIIRTAHKQGLFKDLRLILPALKAIDDGYGEIADYMTQEVLPAYGKAILKPLRESFDFKGGRGHGRRLEVIHKIAGRDAWDLYAESLETGSKEVRLAALRCLGDSGKKADTALPMLIRQTRARSKDVRQAAFSALSRWDNEEVADILIRALSGKNIELVAPSIRSNRNSKVLGYLIGEGNKLLSRLLDKKTKTGDPLFSRFLQILICLETRTDHETERFLLSCLAKADEIISVKNKNQSAYYSGRDIVIRIAELLLQTGTPDALEALIKDHETSDAELLQYSFMAALRSKDPAYIYDTFSPYLTQKSRRQVRTKAKMLISLIDNFLKFQEPYRNYSNRYHNAESIVWDSRWLDAAVRAKARLLVCRLVRHGDQTAIDYLLRCCKKTSGQELYLMLLGLMQAGYPDVTDMLIQAIQNTLKLRSFYERNRLMKLVRLLPPESLPAIEDFVGTLPENALEEMLGHIAELKEGVLK